MEERDRKLTSHDFNLDDPLGIAREPVPATPADHLRGMDDSEAEIRRRRARAGLDGHDDRPRPGMGDVNVDSHGVEGTDMGYGGGGTDVKP